MRIEVKVYRQVDRDWEEIVWSSNGRTLRGGDRPWFEVTNVGQIPLDLTLLYVNSGYGILSFFPTFGGNRLAPGESTKILAGEITEETLGREQVVAIAVAADGTVPVNFSYLEQPTLTRERTRGSQAPQTPLARLLAHATYGVGSTRGLASTTVESYAVKVLGFNVVPGDRSPDPD